MNTYIVLLILLVTKNSLKNVQERTKGNQTINFLTFLIKIIICTDYNN